MVFGCFRRGEGSVGAARRSRLRYFGFRNVDPRLLAAAGSSRRTGSASSQRGHESRRRCSRIPRPPGLTVPDRSTMWSLSPAHAPPIPPPPHIPTPGTETERNRMDQACVVGPLLLGMWSRRSGSAGWPQFQRETFGTPGKT